MKYLALFLLLIASASWAGWMPLNSFGPQNENITVLNQTQDAIEIEVTLPGFFIDEMIEEGSTYHRIRLNSFQSTSLEIGKPEIPLIGENLGIPKNGKVSFEIVETETETFTGYTLYPTQEPTTDNNTQYPFTIDKDFYAQNVNYPNSIVQLTEEKIWRDLSLVNLTVLPFQYNPATQELTAYKKIKVRISIEGGDRSAVEVARRYNAMYKKAILNYEWMSIETRDAGINYLAIVYDSFLDEAAPLTDWYHKKGVTIDVVPSSTAGSNYTQIKTYITNHYNANATDYVLLVGDVAQIPTYTGYTCPASDAWYSFITGSDYYAELAIGRLSASSPSDITNIVNKILAYEKNPPLNDWLIKSTLVAHEQDYPGKYSLCKRQIYNYSYSYFTPIMDTIMGALTGNNNAKVTTTINEGRNVVNYRGHGDIDIWWQWDYLNEHWSTTNVNALSNGDETPVVFNIACLCANIIDSECLSECWIRKNPGGAVASLGASNPSYTTPNHDYDKALYRAYCDSTIWNVGWASNYAAAVIIPQGTYAIENVKMYLWTGDPMTEMWTAIPTPLVASHSPNVPLGPSNFTVTVSDAKAPVENALVCAMKGSETWESGYTNASGQVTLNITPSTPGTLYVTATAHDYLPYEGFALANSGPYCVYDSHIIDDATGGNGDGVVSAYESINMPVLLENIGVDVAKDVVAYLRLEVPNSYLSFTDTVSSYGDVLPDSVVQGTPPYSFDISGACPNGETISFELEVMDSAGNDWVQTFQETVWNSEITYEGFIIDDAGQGNPNGKLNFGETVDFIVSLKNWSGYAHATNVTGVLHLSDPYVTATDSTANYPDITPDATVDNSSNPYVLVASNSLPFDHQVDCDLYITTDNSVDTFNFHFIAGERTTEDPTGPDNEYLYWAYDMTDVIYTECPTYDWVEIDPNHGGSGTLIPLGDNETTQIELPFSFVYHGISYDTVSVCSNGWIAFGTTTDTTYEYYSVPSPQGPPAAVGVFWGDLLPNINGDVYCRYRPALHVFVIEWSRVNHKETYNETFEVILYDPDYNPTVTGDGEIFCQYLIVSRPADSYTGIEDETETVGLMYQISNVHEPGSAQIEDHFVLKFTTDPPEYLGVAEKVEIPVSPKVFGLSQNIPNPFYNRTQIHYQIPEGKNVHTELKIYDVTGKLVRTLVKGEHSPGYYTTTWNGTNDFGTKVSAGIYFVRFASGTYTKSGKMLFLK